MRYFLPPFSNYKPSNQQAHSSKKRPLTPAFESNNFPKFYSFSSFLVSQGCGKVWPPASSWLIVHISHLRKTILSLIILPQSNRVYWYSFVVLGYLLGRLGRQESLPHIMWSRLSSLLICIRGLATKERKNHKEKSFCQKIRVYLRPFVV